jgi:hypothetical protein
MSDNGTGMASPANPSASGAITSQEVGRKKPTQGKFKSGVANQRSGIIVDRNKHGIRRERNLNQPPKRSGRPKKV